MGRQKNTFKSREIESSFAFFAILHAENDSSENSMSYGSWRLKKNIDNLAISLLCQRLQLITNTTGNRKFSDFRVFESPKFKVRDSSYMLKRGALSKG